MYIYLEFHKKWIILMYSGKYAKNKYAIVGKYYLSNNADRSQYYGLLRPCDAVQRQIHLRQMLHGLAVH